MTEYPSWVLEHKKPGTEIRNFKNKYYLYQVESKWDKEKKRAVKITKAYLGRITQEGFIAKGTNKSSNILTTSYNYAIKEFGATTLVKTLNESILEHLKLCFPDNYQELIVLSCLRLIHNCAFKNISFLYENSYLSEFYEANVSDKSITDLLNNVGKSREQILNFFKNFNQGNCILFDATHIFTQSKNLGINRCGYNSDMLFNTQVNLLYAFSVDNETPAYYRLIPGDIREVNAFKLCIEESGIKNTIIVADKGFYSKVNHDSLDKAGLQYILPIRRNSELLKSLPQELEQESFIFNDRPIWYYKQELDNYTLFTFLDNKLQYEEKQDYLLRMDKECQKYNCTSSELEISTIINEKEKFAILHNGNCYYLEPDITHIYFCKDERLFEKYQQEFKFAVKAIPSDLPLNPIALKAFLLEENLNYTMEEFNLRKLKFGTISMLTNTQKSAKEVYNYYKSRMEIENLFDAYKNVLEADKTYMRDEIKLEAWLFINHLAAMYYYSIIKTLRKNNLLSKYSPKDVLMQFSHIKKIKINNEWHNSEINTKTKKLISKLGLDETYYV